jgi:hypothetical protein
MKYLGIEDYNLIKDELFKARKCMSQYSCLCGGRNRICEVDRLMGEKLLFVRKLSEEGCGYKISISNSSLCSCPVRKKIYYLHRI